MSSSLSAANSDFIQDYYVPCAQSGLFGRSVLRHPPDFLQDLRPEPLWTWCKKDGSDEPATDWVPARSHHPLRSRKQ
ncbi:hypothetical protein MLD38_037537 [Melastoma candidum]|uniref:Uncharacterized protein n=1 Tax=Melastoma candidum TaxID=119954 RepID=A0ACB9LPR0_9MYRT|nr:hypothetical protein MLD38_037537 [Melastoma candidum]